MREKMCEVKDPKIKLFGQTIEAAVGETAQSCDGIGVGEDSSIQDPPSSSNSIIQKDDFTGDAEDQESNTVPFPTNSFLVF